MSNSTLNRVPVMDRILQRSKTRKGLVPEDYDVYTLDGLNWVMSHLYGVSLPTILVAAKSTSRRVCGSEMESVSSPDSLTLALTEVNGKAGKQRIYSRLGRKAIELKTISADGSLIHTRETILCPSTPFKTDGRTLDPRYYQEYVDGCRNKTIILPAYEKRCPNTNSLGKHLKTHKEIILGKATGGGANQLEKDRAANFYRSLTNNGDHDKTIMQSGHGTTCPTSTRSSSYESDYKGKRLSKQANIFKKEYEEALSAKLKRHGLIPV
ncbi:hypothetical protein F9C07_2110563 [Aspergillus flavus]|uniref:Uncharacterized protein n=1 Tax=Aspergillus flavus (strain ATCC 200026 / FGSC A1120 / IAM 13836 / NRRL 3357 / JCM 12722 / SRRC 167) TaxID=332952 RepID=A0A7U2MZC1_ASPFN|nr:hypothetical protein F9C07_2110563 [Aspergillus flavus]